ncbi:MAG TPA: hypothetical protein VF303_03235 [Candidatus Nanoarchaeia archaeon]
MPEDTDFQPPKPTAIYSNPLRIGWRNVILGAIIGFLALTIALLAISYYRTGATPIPPVVIKKASPSAQIATPSATATESATPSAQTD